MQRVLRVLINGPDSGSDMARVLCEVADKAAGGTMRTQGETWKSGGCMVCYSLEFLKPPEPPTTRSGWMEAGV